MSSRARSSPSAASWASRCRPRATGSRADALGLVAGRHRQHARPRASRLLPHARAAPRAVRLAMRGDPLPIGVEHELTGIVDLLHMTAYTSPEGDREGKPGEIPAELAEQVEQYRTQMLDSVVETDEGLMERYLDGQELSAPKRSPPRMKTAVTRGELFPVACCVATKNLGTTALLDLLVEGVPSPAKKGAPIEIEGAQDCGVRLQDRRRPVRGAHQHLPRAHRPDRLGFDSRQRAHARQGARRPAADAAGQGARAGRGVRRGRPRRRVQAQGRQNRRPACSTPTATSSCRASTSPSR